ncbi:MAG: hypothetical protein AABX26_02285 [Nanoarchaeota archaeon]
MKRSEKALGKQGAMEMSFGMIFSIILIIFFLSFAFFGIKTFLGIQDTAKTTKFLSDFKTDVEQVWKSPQASQEKEYTLPSKKEKVCFVDFSIPAKGTDGEIYGELKRAYYGKENMIFYPVVFEGVESVQIRYIDLSTITADANPFCIKNVDGEVSLRLTKDFADALVTITR